MTILKDVIAELIGMFAGDARLSAAILIVVAISAGLIEIIHVQPLVGGAVLLVGSLTVVPAAARLAVRRQSAATGQTGTRESG